MATRIITPLLAIESEGQYLTKLAAYPHVGIIDLPAIPFVPLPQIWSWEGYWPWVDFATTPPTIPDLYEVEVNLQGMTWLAVLRFPDVTLEQWQALGVLRYRKYKSPEAAVLIDNPNYEAAKAAYNQAKYDYLAAIQARFVLVGTHITEVDGRKVIEIKPIPEDHPLYDVTWLGKVNSTCLQPTYDLRIRRLLGIY